MIERVSTLELFFDLVFVFTITQLTAVIGEAPTEESGAHHPFEPLATGLAVSLGAGAALYLAGDAWFRQRLRIADPRPRLDATLPALATIPLGIDIAATAQLAALVAIFLALFATEAPRATDTRPMRSTLSDDEPR